MRIRVVVPSVARESETVGSEHYSPAARLGTDVSIAILDDGPASIESSFEVTVALPDTVSKIVAAEATSSASTSGSRTRGQSSTTAKSARPTMQTPRQSSAVGPSLSTSSSWQASDPETHIGFEAGCGHYTGRWGLTLMVAPSLRSPTAFDPISEQRRLRFEFRSQFESLVAAIRRSRQAA
jgi:hypothetical protein